jgi:hypothetical protein
MDPAKSSGRALACGLLEKRSESHWDSPSLERSRPVETTQLTFRLPDDLVTRVEDCVARIRETSRLNITRAEVVRLLLTRALDSVGCDLNELIAAPAKPRRSRRRR